jgi:hypothetical protein
MSTGRTLGIGGTVIALLAAIRYLLPTVLGIRRRYQDEEDVDQQRQRERERIDENLAADRERSFELMAERARERPEDKVQLFDAEHRPLGWGLRLGADPLGRPVIWVPPAVYDLVTSAEDASGPIENVRFDDGGIEGPWDEELRDGGEWKLPSEPGWAVPPERGEHGRWSDQT